MTAHVTGSVSHLERILLPPGHVVSVRLEEVSRADAPGALVGEVRIETAGLGPPYPFTVAYDDAAIDDRRSYAVRATIHDPDGALLYATDDPHAVPMDGGPATVDLIVRRPAVAPERP